MRKEDLLNRIDTVLEKGRVAITTIPQNSRDLMLRIAQGGKGDPDHQWVEGNLAYQFRTAGLSLLQSMCGPDHQLYKDFEHLTNNKNTVVYHKKAHAIIVGLREEVDRGWLADTRALIAADIFANILEMAEYLLSEGYKDAAAVLGAGSLEGHLKSLAPRHGVDIHFVDNTGTQRPKKAETLNQELYKADAYKLGDQKQVTAWLNLRNHAAHSEYDKYAAQEVNLMLQGVQNFIVRVPV